VSGEKMNQFAAPEGFQWPDHPMARWFDDSIIRAVTSDE